MKKYLLKRLLRLIPVFLGVTILAFLLTGLSSVDAVDLKESSSGGVMSEAEKEAMREELGLNEPKAVQYLQWLKNALRGDFGESYVSGKPVLASFCEKLPATIALAALALAMTVCLSFPLGILSAKYQNTWADRSISLFCFAGNSFPGFFTALLLLSFFSLKWNLFPVLSMGKGWKSCVLPAATLAVSMTAKYTRQVRSAVLAELEQEYVAGARARGLSENRILFGNVLKSVLLRMGTLLFLSAGSLLGGTAIVETIFMWNGVGKMAVDAVSMHDIPVIQAYLVWMAAIYLLLHPSLLLADEPTSALDVVSQAQVLRELQALQQKEQTGMVLVTHNLAVLEQMADRVVVLKDGNIVEQGETRTVFDHPKDEYTKNLLAAVPGRGKKDA